MWCPRRLILDNHEPFERAHVIVDRVAGKRPFYTFVMIVPDRVRDDLAGRGLSGDIACERAHELLHPSRISRHAIDPAYIDPPDLIEISAHSNERIVGRQLLESGPATNTNPIDKAGNAKAGLRCTGWITV
jgi:hypothetical protein